MADSTLAKRPEKPREDFPLFPHRNGRWAKKVRGRFVYFGKWADDPKGEAAVDLWLDQKDDLLAGRTPRSGADGLTVQDACNRFLTSKEQQRDAGELSARAFADYLRTAKTLVDAFGARRLVEDLRTDDFQALRARFSRRWGVHRVSNEVQRTRSIFKWVYESELIDRPLRFGPSFKKPPARVVKAHRQKTVRTFDAGELRTVIKAAPQPLKAMILLGVNCGFGNHDVGTLPLSAVDLDAGWVDYPRPKTAVPRRCWLWPETVKALRQAIEQRPKAKSRENAGLVFLTKFGEPWARDVDDSPVSKRMRKLLNDLELYRRGLGFYSLRHTFATIAGETTDQVAVNAVMGHADGSVPGMYRGGIGDDRLKAVATHVRKWLFPRRKTK